MNKELVIALHQRDLEWLNSINKDVKITVYRKENHTSYPGDIYIPNNVGRDVHTFFYHIVNNYDSLSDYTFFSQDYPFDHIEKYVEVINGDQEVWNTFSSQHRNEYWGYYNTTLVPNLDITPSTSFRGNTLKCDKNGSPAHPNLPIEEIWDELFDVPCPDILEFTPGAHFSISKNQIHLRSLDFYKKVLILLETKYDAPWVIERLEPYIFNPDIL